jgi:hypothetical protein
MTSKKATTKTKADPYGMTNKGTSNDKNDGNGNGKSNDNDKNKYRDSSPFGSAQGQNDEQCTAIM